MKLPVMHLLALVVLCGMAHSASAQRPDTLWTKTLGGSLPDDAYAIQETADGGFIVGGQTFSFAAGASDAWLIRTDAQGDTLWTRTYGRDVSVHESARSVAQTSDGGFVMTGTVNATFADVLLIRTDASGDTLWTRTYGEFDIDSGHDVVETPDGGFVICGTTRSYHPGFGSSLWLIRTSADGDSLWTRVYGGSSYQEGRAIERTSDDGFIVTGSYNDGGSQSADIWLLRTDAEGDTLWTRTFGGAGTQQGYTVLQTSDGGYAVGASYYDAGSTVMLIRTDPNGNALWTQTFEGSIDGAGALDETLDGGFVITGSTMDGDALLIRTDRNGAPLWTSTFGGGDADRGSAVLHTADGGYLVAGVTASYGAGQSDAWLIRLGSETPAEDQQIDEIARFTDRKPLFNKLKSDAPADFDGDGITDIAALVGDYDGDGRADLGVMQGCTLKLFGAGGQHVLWQYSFEEEYTMDGDDLLCINDDVPEDVEIKLHGFLDFSGSTHALLEVELDDGNQIIAVLVAVKTNKVAWEAEARVVGVVQLPDGRPVILAYIEQDNAFSVVGEVTTSESTGTASLAASTPPAFSQENDYRLDLKFESEPGLRLAYDPGLVDPSGDTDLDGDGHLDIPMLIVDDGQLAGVDVRGGDGFRVLWQFAFPAEHRENILKGVHGFADIDGDGQKDVVAGDNLVVTLDGTVHTIAENFVTLDVNDVDGDGYGDVIGLNTADSTVVVYGFISTGSSAEDSDQAAIHAALFQNYPNPFRETTAIAYEVAQMEHVTIAVFDVLGRRVRTLVDELQPTGKHQVAWDGRDGGGQLVAAGTYFYQLRMGKVVSSRQAVRIR